MNGHFVRGREGRPEIVLEDVHAEILGELCRGMIELVQPRPSDNGGKSDPLAQELGLDGLDWSGLDGEDTPSERMTAPEDPVLARLFPDAYHDDVDAASEFRRYTENDLRLRKCDHARTVRADIAASASHGGHIVLADPHVQAWLGALNDLRLALGTDLGVGEDVDDFADSLEPDDPRFTTLVIYRWLGELLESLVESLTP